MERIGTLIIGAVIAVVLFAALLVPVIDSATATEDTYHNDGLFSAVPLDENSSHTLTFDYATPNVLTIDGEDMDMSFSSPYSSATVIFSNDWFMRFVPNTGVVLYKCGTSSSQAIKGATASSEISVTVTIASGSASFVYSDETTITYDVAGDGLIITPDEGTYVMKTASSTAFVNGNSIVYGVGRTDRALGTSGTSFNVISMASVDEGVTPLYYSPQYVWGNDNSVAYTTSATHEDLYSLSGFTFNLVTDGDGGPVNHPVTYNQIFVPYEVTAERTAHLTAAELSLVGIIPILVLAGVLVAIAYVVGSRAEIF